MPKPRHDQLAKNRPDHIGERYKVMAAMQKVAGEYGIPAPLLDRICVHVGHCLASQVSTATAVLVTQTLLAKGPERALPWAKSLEVI
jgi:hypothetical protein